MRTIIAEQAQPGLYNLLDEVAFSHEPIHIIGKRSNAVLISEDDWRAVQEKLYLLSVPGMRKSIQAGLQTPVEDCAEELVW